MKAFLRKLLIDDFSKPYKLDKKHNGGDLKYVHEDIPSEAIKLYKKTNGLESAYVEITLIETK